MLFLKIYSLLFGIFEDGKKLTIELFFSSCIASRMFTFSSSTFPLLLCSPSNNQAFQMLMTWTFFSFWPFQFWGTASFSLLGITTIWIQSFIRNWRLCRGWGGTTSRSVKCKDGLYSWVVSHAVFHLFVELPGFFLPSGLTVVVLNFLLHRL